MSEPTPDGLALTFEFVRSKKGSFYVFIIRVCRPPGGAKIHRKPADAIPRRSLLKIALNLDLTLSDDGECPTFFDSLQNH